MSIYDAAFEAQAEIMYTCAKVIDHYTHGDPERYVGKPWASAALLASIAGKLAGSADPYYWSAPIVSLVKEAGNKLTPFKPPMTLFPSRSAFWLLEKPIPILWWAASDEEPDKTVLGDALNPDGTYDIVIISWEILQTAEEANQWGMPDSARNFLPQLGIATHARVDGKLLPLRLAHVPIKSNWPTGTDDLELQDLMRFIGAGLLFMNQQILVTHVGQPSRSMKRRYEKEAKKPWDPDKNVKIILLRRIAQRDHSSDDSESRNWHYRWIVRGHWRQQWYPKQKVHMPKWIGSYVKGPEDKPVKESQKLFAIVR